MAKARKLKSGNWNIQVLDYVDEDGKKHVASFTAPTKAEVEYMAAKHKKERPAKEKRAKLDITVGEAIDKYIKLSEPSLSTTTIDGYKKFRQYGFQDIMKLKASSLDDEAMQEAINRESCRLSERTGKPIGPKTVKNEWGLIAASLKAICGKTYVIKLPKQQKHIRELPEPEEIMEALIGSSIELPCLLAMWLSFSMSEIRGLMCSSVQDGYIIISQVVVDAGGEAIVKANAKTEARLRKHRLPPYLLDLIHREDAYKHYQETGEDAPLIALTRRQIFQRWQNICKANGFDMTFHDLRHMNASIMLMLGVPEKYAMERGGWSTPHVMKSVYQHTLSKERTQVDDLIDGYFDKIIEHKK